MGKRYNRDNMSEAQSDALYRRDHTFTEASRSSFTVSWDWHKREPKDLREAVRMVRQAYADEVPMRLHEGYDAIGEGGTPKMDVRAEGYLFGRDDAGEARPGETPAIDYYRTPFRATLSRYETHRKAIVEHVAIGSMNPVSAAITEGVPYWCARMVAEDTLRGFLRSLSDVKVDDSGKVAA